VAGEIHIWWEGGTIKHAAAASLTGIPPRRWHSQWVDGRAETLIEESKGELVGKGSGWHRAPAEVLRAIPAGLEPVFGFVRPPGASEPTPKPAPPAKPKPPKPSKPKEKPVPKKKPAPAPAPPPAGEADPLATEREALASEIEAGDGWGERLRRGEISGENMRGRLNAAAARGLK
jgi:hypothetical protein